MMKHIKNFSKGLLTDKQHEQMLATNPKTKKGGEMMGKKKWKAPKDFFEVEKQFVEYVMNEGISFHCLSYSRFLNRKKGELYWVNFEIKRVEEKQPKTKRK